MLPFFAPHQASLGIFSVGRLEPDIQGIMSPATVFAVVLALVATASSGPLPGDDGRRVSESPQSAYLGLPSGSDDIVNRPIDINFSCAHRSLGYYADVSNACKIFHVCNPVLMTDGQVAMMQYSFVCPNNTLFDQQTLTCTFPPGTAPCQNAESFYYLNRHVGQNGFESVPAATPQQMQQQPQQQQQQPQQHQQHQQPAVVPTPHHPAQSYQAAQDKVSDAHKSHEAPKGDSAVVRPASYYTGKTN
ncbi:hypothetical protein ISCGN_019606 [Ixodes scapularis]